MPEQDCVICNYEIEALLIHDTSDCVQRKERPSRQAGKDQYLIYGMSDQ